MMVLSCQQSSALDLGFRKDIYGAINSTFSFVSLTELHETDMSWAELGIKGGSQGNLGDKRLKGVTPCMKGTGH